MHKAIIFGILIILLAAGAFLNQGQLPFQVFGTPVSLDGLHLQSSQTYLFNPPQTGSVNCDAEVCVVTESSGSFVWYLTAGQGVSLCVKNVNCDFSKLSQVAFSDQYSGSYKVDKYTTPATTTTIIRVHIPTTTITTMPTVPVLPPQQDYGLVLIAVLIIGIFVVAYFLIRRK